jgi:hypothetical protein
MLPRLLPLLLLVLLLAAWPTAQPVQRAEWVSVSLIAARNLECIPPGHLGPAKACAQPEEPGACHTQVWY